MIEQNIYQALSPLVGDRVWPVVVPQEQRVWPGITFQRLETSLSGDEIGASDLKLRVAEGHKSVFQVVVWADNYGDLPTLLRTVKTAMLGIPGVQFVGASDGFDQTLGVWSSIQEYQIWGDLHESRTAAAPLAASPISNFLQAVAGGLTMELTTDSVVASVGVPTFSSPDIPGVLVDVESVTPGQEKGDERTAIRCQVVAHCIHGFWAAADLSARVILAVESQNRWNLETDVGAPEDISASPGQVNPGEHGYDHWIVTWTQDLYVGTDVWSPSGVRPDTVYLGWDPDIGFGHEMDYDKVIKP